MNVTPMYYLHLLNLKPSQSKYILCTVNTFQNYYNKIQLTSTKMKFICKAILLNQNYRGDVSSLTIEYGILPVKVGIL